MRLEWWIVPSTNRLNTVCEAVNVGNTLRNPVNLRHRMDFAIFRVMSLRKPCPSLRDKFFYAASLLAARARRFKRQHGLDVLMIDYIQLMTTHSKRSSENRVQEMTAITIGLKALAKELNIPIIALSQFSHQVENQTDKRPQLADLRESGSIEQDADIVLFVYREEYYLKKEVAPSIENGKRQWRKPRAKLWLL